MFDSFRDPFSAHRQQMRAMFGPFGLDPFAVTPHLQPHRAPRRQVPALQQIFIYQIENFKQHWLCTIPFRLVLWLPSAWWEWWVAALLACLFLCSLEGFYMLSLLVKSQFQIALCIHICREEGSWTCLAWWKKWWETWWALYSFPLAWLNYSNKSPSNNCCFICCLCLQERMSGAPNCQTFSSSTVISYSSSGAGAPKVYQQTSQTTTGPGGVRMSTVITIFRLLSSFCFVCPDIMRPRRTH